MISSSRSSMFVMRQQLSRKLQDQRATSLNFEKCFAPHPKRTSIFHIQTFFLGRRSVMADNPTREQESSVRGSGFLVPGHLRTTPFMSQCSRGQSHIIHRHTLCQSLNFFPQSSVCLPKWVTNQRLRPARHWNVATVHQISIGMKISLQATPTWQGGRHSADDHIWQPCGSQCFALELQKGVNMRLLCSSSHSL